MKRLLVIGLVLAFGVATEATVATAAKAPAKATVVIRHELKGCHSWSLNGGSFGATHSTTLARGGTIVFSNSDVMPHTLIQKGGPAVHFLGNAAMSHMMASVKIVLTKPGVYKFTTKAGEDYMKGVKTIGEDNVLRLTVTVR